jgi:hypothetical protein
VASIHLASAGPWPPISPGQRLAVASIHLASAGPPMAGYLEPPRTVIGREAQS